MNINKFDVYTELKALAADINMDLFAACDGGFLTRKFINVPDTFDLSQTSGNTEFLIKQDFSGQENIHFDFVLYDYNTKKEYRLGGCYFKTYQNFIDRQTAEKISNLSFLGAVMTSKIFKEIG